MKTDSPLFSATSDPTCMASSIRQSMFFQNHQVELSMMFDELLRDFPADGLILGLARKGPRLVEAAQAVGICPQLNLMSHRACAFLRKGALAEKHLRAVDDIVIRGTTWDDHLDHLRTAHHLKPDGIYTLGLGVQARENNTVPIKYAAIELGSPREEALFSAGLHQMLRGLNKPIDLQYPVLYTSDAGDFSRGVFELPESDWHTIELPLGPVPSAARRRFDVVLSNRLLNEELRPQFSRESGGAIHVAAARIRVYWDATSNRAAIVPTLQFHHLEAIDQGMLDRLRSADVSDLIAEDVCDVASARGTLLKFILSLRWGLSALRRLRELGWSAGATEPSLDRFDLNLIFGQRAALNLEEWFARNSDSIGIRPAWRPSEQATAELQRSTAGFLNRSSAIDLYASLKPVVGTLPKARIGVAEKIACVFETLHREQERKTSAAIKKGMRPAAEKRRLDAGFTHGELRSILTDQGIQEEEISQDELFAGTAYLDEIGVILEKSIADQEARFTVMSYGECGQNSCSLQLEYLLRAALLKLATTCEKTVWPKIQFEKLLLLALEPICDLQAGLFHRDQLEILQSALLCRHTTSARPHKAIILRQSFCLHGAITDLGDKNRWLTDWLRNPTVGILEEAGGGYRIVAKADFRTDEVVQPPVSEEAISNLYLRLCVIDHILSLEDEGAAFQHIPDRGENPASILLSSARTAYKLCRAWAALAELFYDEENTYSPFWRPGTQVGMRDADLNRKLDLIERLRTFGLPEGVKLPMPSAEDLSKELGRISLCSDQNWYKLNLYRHRKEIATVVDNHFSHLGLIGSAYGLLFSATTRSMIQPEKLSGAQKVVFGRLEWLALATHRLWNVGRHVAKHIVLRSAQWNTKKCQTALAWYETHRTKDGVTFAGEVPSLVLPQSPQISNPSMDPDDSHRLSVWLQLTLGKLLEWNKQEFLRPDFDAFMAELFSSEATYGLCVVVETITPAIEAPASEHDGIKNHRDSASKELHAKLELHRGVGLEHWRLGDALIIVANDSNLIATAVRAVLETGDQFAIRFRIGIATQRDAGQGIGMKHFANGGENKLRAWALQLCDIRKEDPLVRSGKAHFVFFSPGSWAGGEFGNLTRGGLSKKLLISVQMEGAINETHCFATAFEPGQIPKVPKFEPNLEG